MTTIPSDGCGFTTKRETENLKTEKVNARICFLHGQCQDNFIMKPDAIQWNKTPFSQEDQVNFLQ